MKNISLHDIKQRFFKLFLFVYPSLITQYIVYNSGFSSKTVIVCMSILLFFIGVVCMNFESGFFKFRLNDISEATIILLNVIVDILAYNWIYKHRHEIKDEIYASIESVKQMPAMLHKHMTGFLLAISLTITALIQARPVLPEFVQYRFSQIKVNVKDILRSLISWKLI